MLSAGEYLLGALALAVTLAGVALGARALGRHLLPEWEGPPRWLADLVLGAGILVLLAETLGAFGLLRPLPLAAVALAAGAALRFGPIPRLPGPDAPAPPAPPVGAAARIVALAALGLLVAHWAIGTRLHLDVGMTGFDSNWYHGPFAARFGSGEGTFDLQFVAPQFLAWFYPANSELLHGVGIAALDRDVLSPLLNLGWMAAALLAAWCVGRPFGAGPVSLLAVAVLLDSGVMADQAGEARNDVIAIFFLLAAAAILVNLYAGMAGADRIRIAPDPLRRVLPAGALVVAGLATGLAAGTKLNLLVPAAVLGAGVPMVVRRAERSRSAVAFGIPLLLGCGFWYLRNLVQAGSPLPWVNDVGPIELPGPEQDLGGREQHSVAEYLFDGEIWSDWFLPGFHDGLGLLWPLALGLAIAPLAVALIGRGSDPLLRLLGAAGIAGAAAWLLEPASAAGPEGEPVAFVSNLRHLAPGLALGLAMLPVLRLRRQWPAWALLAALAATLLFADASADPWHSGYVAGALALGAIAALAGFALSARHSLPGGAAVHAAATIALLAVAVATGYVVQREYLRDRYARADFSVAGLDAAFRWARDVEGARIGTTSTRSYPLYGTDLTNEVEYVGRRRPEGGFVPIESCRVWRRAVNEGNYDFVVASFDRAEARAFPPQADWTRDAATRRILTRSPTVIFRIDGRLDPAACRSRAG